ncbi:MAG: hypothetical protein SF187_12090 [Deltaproteobacteria bacterium]|nr:hypothetical protein [Deltaproteobacteria bacterium]
MNTSRAKIGILGCLMLLLQTSCGGGDASTASEFASSYCGLLKPCCAMAGLATDGKQCEAFIGFFSTGYNADKGRACLDELRANSQKSDFCDLNPTSSATCDGVFTSASGKKKPGETCEDDDECAASAEGEVDCATEFVNNARIQKCQVQVRGKEGDGPCTGTVDGSLTSFGGAESTDVPAKAFLCYVADGLSCSSKTGVCTKIQPIGGACQSSFQSYQCVDEAYCDTTKMMCVAKLAVGAPCSFVSTCVDAAYCDEATDVCVARRANAAACDNDDQCLSDNCVNGKCATDTSVSDFGLSFVCGEKS